MAEIDQKKRTNREKNRLKRMLKDSGTPKDRVDILLATIENVAWMKVKLEDARTQVGEADLVVEYDNGGGQKGMQENPQIKAYRSLWQSYMTGMGKILSALPEGKAEDASPSAPCDNVLELIRSKKNA